MFRKSFINRALFILAVFLTAPLSCDNGTTSGAKTQGTETDTKKVDSRLVGGKWYVLNTSGNNYFYRFSETAFINAYAGESHAVTVPAYTKDGKILNTDTDAELLSYTFVDDESVFSNKIIEAENAGNQESVAYYQRLQAAARTENLVSFHVPGTANPEYRGRWENVPTE